MLEGKIQTDAYVNPTGTIEHANLILAAPVSAGLTVYVSGGTLVSLDLPLEKVDATAYQDTLAMNLSVQSQGIIAAMIASGAQWAADAGTVTESQKHITGQQSRADNFAATVQGMLNILNVSDGSTQVISAQFGVYGALPVVAVQLEDAVLLLDPLNGNLSGPFTRDAGLDARGLLSQHPEYVAYAAVRYYSPSGTVLTNVATTFEQGPCDQAPVATCSATNANELQCDSTGFMRCSCIQENGVWVWHCTACPTGKSCVPGVSPSGTPRLNCQ